MSGAALEGPEIGTKDIVSSYARPGAEDHTRPSPFRGRKPVRPDGLVNLSAGLNHYNAWARGAGAVVATVQDLAKFMDAVESGRLTVLSDQSNAFARSRQKRDSYFDWNGGSWGIQSTILYEPYRGITVIVLTNASNVGPGSHEIAKDLLTLARTQRPPDANL
jgi:CubicO group peptidase (beta-lactamase class C family)